MQDQLTEEYKHLKQYKGEGMNGMAPAEIGLNCCGNRFLL